MWCMLLQSTCTACHVITYYTYRIKQLFIVISHLNIHYTHTLLNNKTEQWLIRCMISWPAMRQAFQDFLCSTPSRLTYSSNHSLILKINTNPWSITEWNCLVKSAFSKWFMKCWHEDLKMNYFAHLALRV